LLSLNLEANEKLDRHLEVLGKGFAGIVEEGVKEGIVRVWAYPHPGAIVAASLAFAHLYSIGVFAAFRVSLRPPPIVEVPTILFGYPTLNYKSSDVTSKLIAVTHEEFNRGHPPPGAFYVGVDGSLASAYIMMAEASGLGGISTSLQALALPGIYLDGKVSRSGRIGGIDRVLVERLSQKGEVHFKIVTTLKVYKPHTRPFCESASATLIPPLDLGSTYQECLDLLSSAGLRRVAEKPASSLESNEIDEILELIAERLGAEIEAGEYVAGVLVAEGASPQDPREAAHALVNAVESSQNYASILAAYLAPETEYTALERLLEDSAPAFLEKLLSAKPSRARGPGWLRVYTLGVSIESPTLSYLALRSINAIDKDVVIGVPKGDSILISPLQASLVDYTLPRRLIESRAALEEEFWLRLTVEEPP